MSRFKENYIDKKLEKFYRRIISRRQLDLSREECDKIYGSNSDFFHLNVHTKFSILGGVDEPSEIFQAAKDCGMQGLAVTETGYMSSIPDCYLSAKSTGLKYIPGISAHFSDYEVVRREIEKSEDDELKNHQALITECRPWRTPQITLLAKNQQGYKELLELNAKSWSDGYYYVPKINRKMLKKYANGNIIVLSGNLIDKFIEFGYIASVENPQYGALCAQDYIKWFYDIFGDDFYLELTMRCQDTVWGSDLDRLTTTNMLLNRLDLNVNTVITNDVKHIQRKHSLLYRSMLAIGRNTTLKRIRDYSNELYFKTRSELEATFDRCLYDRALTKGQFNISCDNTMIIADKCDTFIADTKPKLPEIDNADQILTKKSIKALMKLGLHKDQTKYDVDGKMVTYFEQTKIELNRFIEKGFASYFLIMQDLVKHSHDLNWQTGPARGSAGGSLVCYLLGITSIDPIKFELSFDRFLSPSRGGHMLKISM